MTDSDPIDSLARCRADARRLHHDLRAADPARAHAAAARFLRLRSFAGCSVADLLASPARVRRKHALAVIAEERGAPSWLALRARLAPEHTTAVAPPEFYAPSLAVFLNRWSATHAEAQASLRAQGGYLLPFRDQCFVAGAPAIAELGLDPDDPDWAAAGFDLVQPADAAARDRLCDKRRAAIAAGIGVPETRRLRP